MTLSIHFSNNEIHAINHKTGPKAIYIRFADKSHVDGNTMLGGGGLCKYVNYERLGDFSD